MKFIGIFFLVLYSLFRYFIRFMEVVLKFWYIIHYPVSCKQEWVGNMDAYIIHRMLFSVCNRCPRSYYWLLLISLSMFMGELFRILGVLFNLIIDFSIICSFLRHCNKRALLLWQYMLFFISNYLLALRFIWCLSKAPKQ